MYYKTALHTTQILNICILGENIYILLVKKLLMKGVIDELFHSWISAFYSCETDGQVEVKYKTGSTLQLKPGRVMRLVSIASL
jgi:hypothetical protein